MRASCRILLSHSAIVVLLLTFRVGKTLAQTSSAPNQPAQSASAAQNLLPPKWNEAVRALAEKIAAAAGTSRQISMEVKNISSLGFSATSQIRLAIESELTGKGFKPAPDGLRVRVTLSEGTEGFVWVAEIQLGDSSRVVAVSLSSSINSNIGLHPVAVVQKTTIWQQDVPFLDFSESSLLAGTIRVLYVLNGDRVEIYHGLSRHWSQPPQQWFILTSQGSRDTRGRIIPSTNGTVKAWVGTNVCASPPIFSIFYCEDSPGQRWPIGDGWDSHYSPGRNYFTGLSADFVPKEIDPRPFFAVSRLEYDHGSDWIETELDGMARLYKSSPKPSGAFSGWGDDIASVNPGCGASWQILVTGPGDWTKADYIQLYEIDNDQPKPVGQRLEFLGPILAMWSSDDKKSARVVSRNLQTGMYEASIVSVSCSD
jgi:hypothetical protein